VRVSAAALQMAREFGEQVRHARPERVRLVAFDWAISRGIRRRVDGPMEELGPGLDLVSFDAAHIPREAIHETDGFLYVVKIPREVYDFSAQRLIDVDEAKFGGLTLR
jgi:hypothetical protein